MPQLDKLSFATQYFWLTLFFFGLYFLSVNFFVILVFKNLKLRNMIYKIWYFFLYKFDYVEYNRKNKSLTNACFNSIYYVLYINFFLVSKTKIAFEKIDGLVNKTQTLNQAKDALNSTLLNNFLSSNSSELSRRVENLNIYEI